jgi:hypothetical protein
MFIVTTAMADLMPAPDRVSLELNEVGLQDCFTGSSYPQPPDCAEIKEI